MKKVICIAKGQPWVIPGMFIKKHWWSKKKPFEVKGPKEHDKVTVVKEYWIQGECVYSILEWPEYPWRKKYFTDVQESATEFEEVTYSEIKKEVPVSAN